MVVVLFRIPDGRDCWNGTGNTGFYVAFFDDVICLFIVRDLIGVTVRGKSLDLGKSFTWKKDD